MQRGLHLRLGRHRFDNRIGHVRWMRRGEADSLESVDRRDQTQQAAEVGLAEAISVDCLPEQHDFPCAARSELTDVGQDSLGRRAALASAYVWHHAKRAK